jgi:hypothetical protein
MYEPYEEHSWNEEPDPYHRYWPAGLIEILACQLLRKLPTKNDGSPWAQP